MEKSFLQDDDIDEFELDDEPVEGDDDMEDQLYIGKSETGEVGFGLKRVKKIPKSSREILAEDLLDAIRRINTRRKERNARD